MGRLKLRRRAPLARGTATRSIWESIKADSEEFRRSTPASQRVDIGAALTPFLLTSDMSNVGAPLATWSALPPRIEVPTSEPAPDVRLFGRDKL
jgi:hypothetical protein